MNFAIVVAAGQGTRARAAGEGGRVKQLRELGGVPVIVHTLRRFEQSATVGAVVVVLPADETADFAAEAARWELRKVVRAVPGGWTRTESVWHGLRALPAEGGDPVIAVHDGVRPFVTADEIDRTVRAAEGYGAALLAAPATDTIKEVEGGRVVRTLERARAWHAQTPQCFRRDLLRRAYESALADGIEATDDSSLVERLGAEVALVEGAPRNIKLTRPEDFALAEILLRDFG